MVKRAAFTLIEVVLALVIVAITVLSIPVMTQIQANATEGSIDQEAIYIASAKLLQTLSYPWDENTVNPTLMAEGATVLSEAVDIPGGEPSLDYTLNNCRLGFIHRKCRINDASTNTVNVSTLNVNDQAVVMGLDERSATGVELTNADTTQEGYKKRYTMDVAVDYVSDNVGTGGGIDYSATANPNFIFSDTAAAGATNLKMITLTMRDQNDGGKIITVLRAYAANIGEVKPYKRTY